MRPGDRTVARLADRLRAAGSVWAEEEAGLLLGSGRAGEALDELVRRRLSGEPLEVVLGWVEFAGRRLVVGPGVFVPRRRTELLARHAAGALPAGGTALDLCCGAGAVASVLADVPGAVVHAADIEPAAVACARRNLAGRGIVHRGDLFAPLPAGLRGRLDVVAANAPYVPTGRIPMLPPEARDHEPRGALDGGGDGVDVQRRIAREVAHWLAPAGSVLVETSPEQAGLTRAALAEAGLETSLVTDDALGGCVAVGRLRSAVPG